MIVKVVTYVVCGVLVAGFLLFGARVIALGLREVLSPKNKKTK